MAGTQLAIAANVIGNALGVLALARGSRVDDDRQTHVYVDALIDLDPWVVDRACRQMALTPREAYEPVLPSVGAIRAVATALVRQDAETERVRAIAPIPSDADNDPRSWVFCKNCQDGGWRLYWCPGRAFESTRHARHDGCETSTCTRQCPHGAHSYADRCGCRFTNPRLDAARSAMVRRA